MVYIVEGKEYKLNYQELKEQYYNFLEMTDEEFIDNYPKALHFACIISYLKDISNENLVSDAGLLHEMIHFLDEETKNTVSIQAIRTQFNDMLLLV